MRPSLTESIPLSRAQLVVSALLGCLHLTLRLFYTVKVVRWPRIHAAPKMEEVWSLKRLVAPSPAIYRNSLRHWNSIDAVCCACSTSPQQPPCVRRSSPILHQAGRPMSPLADTHSRAPLSPCRSRQLSLLPRPPQRGFHQIRNHVLQLQCLFVIKILIQTLEQSDGRHIHMWPLIMVGVQIEVVSLHELYEHICNDALFDTLIPSCWQFVDMSVSAIECTKPRIIPLPLVGISMSWRFWRKHVKL